MVLGVVIRMIVSLPFLERTWERSVFGGVTLLVVSQSGLYPFLCQGQSLL